MGIVERIQILCTQNNIKIKPLEQTLGIANGSMKRWDDSSPSCERILKVANYFNVSVDWLITGKNFETDEPGAEILKLYNRLNRNDQEEVIEIIHMKINRYAKEKKTQVLKSSSSEQDEKMA